MSGPERQVPRRPLAGHAPGVTPGANKGKSSRGGRRRRPFLVLAAVPTHKRSRMVCCARSLPLAVGGRCVGFLSLPRALPSHSRAPHLPLCRGSHRIPSHRTQSTITTALFRMLHPRPPPSIARDCEIQSLPSPPHAVGCV